MKQFRIKNDRAATLLDELTKLTGEGKTEAVTRALELYQAKLMNDRDAQAAVASIKQHVHPYVLPQYRGRAPSKHEQEEVLGLI